MVVQLFAACMCNVTVRLFLSIDLLYFWTELVIEMICDWSCYLRTEERAWRSLATPCLKDVSCLFLDSVECLCGLFIMWTIDDGREWAWQGEFTSTDVVRTVTETNCDDAVLCTDFWMNCVFSDTTKLYHDWCNIGCKRAQKCMCIKVINGMS